MLLIRARTATTLHSDLNRSRAIGFTIGFINRNVPPVDAMPSCDATA